MVGLVFPVLLLRTRWHVVFLSAFMALFLFFYIWLYLVSVHHIVWEARCVCSLTFWVLYRMLVYVLILCGACLRVNSCVHWDVVLVSCTRILCFILQFFGMSNEILVCCARV